MRTWKAGCFGNDRAHPVGTDFVAAELEEFTRQVLNLAHSETHTHQLGAKRHDATAEHARKAARTSSFDCIFRARNLLDQRTHLFRRPLLAKEP